MNEPRKDNTIIGNLSDLNLLIKLNINGFPVYYRKNNEESVFYLFTNDESLATIVNCTNTIDFISQCKTVLNKIYELVKQPLCIQEVYKELKGYDKIEKRDSPAKHVEYFDKDGE